MIGGKTVRRDRPDEAGMTLVELLIAMAVFAIILVPIMLILSGAGRGYSATNERSRLERQARQAIAAINAALVDAGADPTGAGLFEAVPEAAPGAITIAADLTGDETDAPPDGDAEDTAERRGFRLLPGGILSAEVQYPGEAFGRLSRTLSGDVRDFSLTYLDSRGVSLEYAALTDDETGHLTRSRIRSIAVRLELYTPAAGEPVVVTTQVSPRNLAVGGLGGSAGGAFPVGEELAGPGGPAVPGEGAPVAGPPELVDQGAAAELRGAGIGDPIVYFDSPAAGARLGGPTPVGAAAVDTDGTVRQVEFYLDDQVLGADGYAPYEIPGGSWNPLAGEYAAADGHHLLYALAIDNRNQLGSDALMVEVAGNGGPALLLDTTHPAYVTAEDPRAGAFWLTNGGDAALELNELRPAWDRSGLLLRAVDFDGRRLFTTEDGLESGEAVRLTEPLRISPGETGELVLRFTQRPGALQSGLAGARLALLAADGTGRRWGVHTLLTPTAYFAGELVVTGSRYASRWREYYRLGHLEVGASPYTDERYVVTALPDSYRAPLWVLAANADRDKGLGETELGREYLGSLRVDNRVHLYLLFDDTATPPLWIRDRFIESRYLVSTDNPRGGRLRLWLGSAHPGEIVFYGARAAGASENVSCMYSLGLGGVFAPGSGE
ncbi:MAG: prepilin-type N-terminal cleavage/methylation domain-containing protein [Candidatus Coatesbacteria bacterium]|nr:prepilin-type N-terminal cleavage/methylation domain-containing protein [Candidatus Coatesbacteria bacterium]